MRPEKDKKPTEERKMVWETMGNNNPVHKAQAAEALKAAKELEQKKKQKGAKWVQCPDRSWRLKH